MTLWHRLCSMVTVVMSLPLQLESSYHWMMAEGCPEEVQLPGAPTRDSGRGSAGGGGEEEGTAAPAGEAEAAAGTGAALAEGCSRGGG